MYAPQQLPFRRHQVVVKTARANIRNPHRGRQQRRAFDAPQDRVLKNWSGIALVLLGVIVNLRATVRYYEIIRELSEGKWRPGRVSRDAVVLAYVLAIAGVGMAFYLGFAR